MKHTLVETENRCQTEDEATTWKKTESRGRRVECEDFEREDPKYDARGLQKDAEGDTQRQG